ncbi:MAG: pantoate--beta-alanine ligase [Candidatus Omnitrophica bacterium]|nr:pantoate--beta-alanine ligase [Candidatus Omnitrophota bacterium]
MKIITDPRAMQRWGAQAKVKKLSVGLVPTMGALHEGHLSLIRRARRQNDRVAVSIFINPIQFNQKSDYRKYPRPLRQDLQLLRQQNVDVVFMPSAESLYPKNFQTFVEVADLSKAWEGKHRPGHFRGVTTVVAKLFNLAQPARAYFGEKDAQQARILEKMAEDLHFPLQVIVLPTVREKSGLAFSSRNARLSPSERKQALVVFHALQAGGRLIECGERRRAVVEKKMRGCFQKQHGVRLEYAAAVHPETFERQNGLGAHVRLLVAGRVGQIRLIDTLLVHRKG